MCRKLESSCFTEALEGKIDAPLQTNQTCSLRWNHRNYSNEYKERKHNTHQINMDTCFQLPQWLSVLLFCLFLVVFTPQLLQLCSGRGQCCETETRVQLLTSDLISTHRWPQCLIWILHDWSALIRSSAWPSLTGSETSDSCSSLWKRRDIAEIRTGSDWNPCWEIMKPLEWISGNQQLISCKHLIRHRITVACYSYYFCRMLSLRNVKYISTVWDAESHNAMNLTVTNTQHISRNS